MASKKANAVGKNLPKLSGKQRRKKGVDRQESRAVTALFDRFGEGCYLDTTGGCKVIVFEVDAAGDCALMVRLSKRDLKGGETAMGQVEDGLRVLGNGSRRVRCIIVALQVSGALLYEKRPDLQHLEQLISDGLVEGVFFRDADRMARHGLILAILQELLEGTETDLYLASPEGRLDWTEFSDRIMLSINGTMSVMERENIRRRTHDAIIRQYLREGRGVSSKRPLGFFRNDDGYLEQHPEEWERIKQIHFGFYAVKEGGDGLRPFAEQLGKTGLDYSHEQIRKILTDEIYVTGHFTTVWKRSEVFDGRVENFSNGIPRHVFERNRVVLAASEKRGNRRTPLGLFALNPVIRCAKCNRRLIGRIQSEDRAHTVVYRHESKPGQPISVECWGDKYERDVLDPFVFKQLLRLDKSEKLRSEWWRNAWPEEAARGMNEEMRERERELQRQIEDLAARQRERWCYLEDKMATEASLHENSTDEQIWAPAVELLRKPDPEFTRINRELRRVRRQLQVLPGITRHRHRKRLDLTVSSTELRTAFRETLDAGIAGTAHEELETGAHLLEIVKSCLTAVLVNRRVEGKKEIIEVQLVGPPVPDGVPPVRVVPPHRNAAYALGFASERAIAAMGAASAAVQTVKQDYSCQTVRTAWRSRLIRLQT